MSFKETEKPSLKVAVVQFPGSNCDLDTIRFFKREGHLAELLWHEERKIPRTDLIVLPGGFPFGDRDYQKATGEYVENPGKKTLESPVMETIYKWVKRGRPVLGICSGFQTLTHAGLLPGALLKNESELFFCDDVDVRVEGMSFFSDPTMKGNVYKINIAHGYGRYTASVKTLLDLEANNQIFLRYHGYNPNGSDLDIAGIHNKQQTVFGMMPHPERADKKTRTAFLTAIESYLNQK
jgi:phosphoribosylformylglycinamidine synthase subunit PurQ / glutaminase